MFDSRYVYAVVAGAGAGAAAGVGIGAEVGAASSFFSSSSVLTSGTGSVLAGSATGTGGAGHH